MENWLIALVLKPFVAVFLLFAIYCAKRAFVRYFPKSRIKSRLLLPVFNSKKPR